MNKPHIYGGKSQTWTDEKHACIYMQQFHLAIDLVRPKLGMKSHFRFHARHVKVINTNL